MPEYPQYQIKANVVDICQDAPQHDDQFFVDTNVWIWYAYSNIQYATRSPMPYQLQCYPDYLAKVMGAGAAIYRCELSFSELANRIESTQCDIFQHGQPRGTISPKAFRHNYPEKQA